MNFIKEKLSKDCDVAEDGGNGGIVLHECCHLGARSNMLVSAPCQSYLSWTFDLVLLSQPLLYIWKFILRYRHYHDGAFISIHIHLYLTLIESGSYHSLSSFVGFWRNIDIWLYHISFASINLPLVIDLWLFMMTSSNGNISALLAFRVGNSPATQRPVTRNFDVFFDLRLNKRLSKESRRRWFETQSCSLWRHCYVAPIS